MSFLPALLGGGLQAAGAIGGGLLGNRGRRETKQERTSRKTADELLASLKGDGPYSSLFNTSDEAFQKSIVDPSLARYRNQIAPAIKEQFVGAGQHRGSSLDDMLARAGVDMQSNIDQLYLPFMQGGQNRMSNALGSILGMGAGAPQRLSGSEAFGQAVGGYTSGDAFSSSLDKILQAYGQQPASQKQNQTATPTTPRGYAPDWQDYELGDPRWGRY